MVAKKKKHGTNARREKIYKTIVMKTGGRYSEPRTHRFKTDCTRHYVI